MKALWIGCHSSNEVKRRLAESYLTTTLSRQILARIERLAWHPI